MKRAPLALLLLALSAPALAGESGAAGLAMSRAGRWAEAAPLLRQALEADPNNATMAAELGLVLYKLGQLREAETVLRRAISLDPGYSNPYLTLGEVLVATPDRWRRRDEL